MLSASDPEYIETKMIKKGLKQMNHHFTHLAEWIFDSYQVKPLNIYYDIMRHNKQPRLQVIFEFYRDIEDFKSDNGLFPNPSRQNELKEAFETFCKDKGKYTFENLYVIFGAFEPIAKEEANGKIPNQRLENLKSDLNNHELWEIKKTFSTGIFFFYTNEQLTRCEKEGEKRKLEIQYFNILKEYDEFNYLDEVNFSIKLDSKENFDKNYKSNWFYYSKDN